AAIFKSSDGLRRRCTSSSTTRLPSRLLRKPSGSSISRRCRGNSQSKYSTSFMDRQIVVFPARRTPGNQITERLFHRRSSRPVQKGRNHMQAFLHIVRLNASTFAFGNESPRVN